MTYKLEINDRAYDAIKAKTKKIEIRANKKNSKIDYSKISIDDTIKFYNSKNEAITCKVIENNYYSSIEELLMLEGTKETLSSTNDYQEGIKSINSLDGYKEAIKENGVQAIHLEYIYTDNNIWEELYQLACQNLNPSQTDCIYYGGVSAAILTDKDNIYTGVCIDTECSMGMCAERNAMASMLTKNETKIKKLVCVYSDKSLMLPCGVCREFMMQLSQENKEAEILVKHNKIVKLDELLPKWRT